MDGLDDQILTLPEDVIIPIFQFLPQFEILHNVRLTCKSWNHYSRDRILWRRIRAHDFIRASFRIENFMRFLCDISHSVEELEIGDEQLYNFQEKHVFFPRLRRLKLYDKKGFLTRYNDQLEDKSLKAITRMYPALEVLHLNYRKSDIDAICFPKDLKELVVANWNVRNTLNYKPSRNVGEHFKNLTHLGLRWCKLNNLTVLALLSWLTCLESVDVSYTKYDHDLMDYKEIPDHDLMDDKEIPDIPCSKRIQKVALRHTDLIFFLHVFTYILESAHESIRYIDISNTRQRSLIYPLHKIAEKCKQLDTLIIGDYAKDMKCKKTAYDSDLSGPYKNEINRGIRDVASNNQHLSTIKLNFFTYVIDDETVLHVFQNCSKLQWIEVFGCESLSDNTLGKIVSAEKLHVMKISKCKYLTSTGIGHALERCSRLRTLHVKGIGTIELILDTQSFRLMNCLTTLSLANCYKLSDDCLDQIAKRCPILRSINLTCCCSITDVGFVQFVEQCARVKEIILDDNEVYKIGLTDRAFAAVANCQNNLERLYLGRFSKITYEAIHELICICPKLTDILFYDTLKEWEFNVVITASKLDMTQAETLEFRKNLRRKLENLQRNVNSRKLKLVSAIRVHRDSYSRRYKEKLSMDCDRPCLDSLANRSLLNYNGDN